MKKMLLFLCSLSFAAALQAQIIHVPADYPTIQQGINAATSGDTVLVAEGTYYEQISFLGKKPLMVASQFLLDDDTSHISKTIIDGSQLTNLDSASVVYFVSGEDTTSVLCGFTIQHGKGTYTPANLDDRQGGGIWIAESGAKISYNRITHNILDDTQAVNGNSVDGAGIGTLYVDSDNWVVIENNIIDSNVCISKYEYAWGAGIGISCNSRIVNNVISNNTSKGIANSAAVGGGIASGQEPSWLTPVFVIIENNEIVNNITQSLNNYANSAGVLVSCEQARFSNNLLKNNHVISGLTDQGGAAGLFLLQPDPGSVVNSNIFKENFSDAYSGGLCLENVVIVDNKVLVESNYFINNEANKGGAFVTFSVPVILQNNVFSGNHADQSGGAAFLARNSVLPVGHLATFINNSFSGNTATAVGGAILSLHSKPLIINSVFWGDSSAIGREISLVFYTDTVEIANSTIFPTHISGNFFDGGGNLNDDPMFLDPVLLTLSPSSYAINAGTKAYACHCGMQHSCPAFDILGLPRPWGSSYADMGAYEFTDFTGTGESGLRIVDCGINIYPNPFTTLTNFNYFLEAPVQVNLRIYDNYGRLVAQPIKAFQQKGEQRVEWNAENLTAGIYFCRLQAGNKVVTNKIVKMQ